MSGCSVLTPTSLLRARWQWLDPAEITEIRASAGSVVLWRPTTLHAVLPHKDTAGPRLAMHVSYGPRWLRQSFGQPLGQQELGQAAVSIAQASPVRQQLLQGFAGDPAELAKLVGKGNRGQTSGSPASQVRSFCLNNRQMLTSRLMSSDSSRLIPSDSDLLDRVAAPGGSTWLGSPTTGKPSHSRNGRRPAAAAMGSRTRM